MSSDKNNLNCQIAVGYNTYDNRPDDKQEVQIYGPGEQHIETDSFQSWFNLMESFGIKGNDALTKRIYEHTGGVYREWEITRYINSTRGVPKKVQQFICQDLVYWLLSGGNLMPIQPSLLKDQTKIICTFREKK